jgi:hypothetical protein
MLSSPEGGRHETEIVPQARRRLLSGQPRAAVPLSCRPVDVATSSMEDPIYRAIEEHVKAGQERYLIGRQPSRTDHELDGAIANELDALRRLFSTAPATHDGMVALFRHCQATLPGDHTTVIDEFVEMCVNGDEDKWSPTRWARMMELALRRIAAMV